MQLFVSNALTHSSSPILAVLCVVVQYLLPSDFTIRHETIMQILSQNAMLCVFFKMSFNSQWEFHNVISTNSIYRYVPLFSVYLRIPALQIHSTSSILAFRACERSVRERPISRSPLKPIFVTPALRSAPAPRPPAHRSAPAHPIFRYPLTLRSVHMLFLREFSRATDSISITTKRCISSTYFSK